MDDLLCEFLTETNESLDSLDIELVRLEQNPNDPELISNIFRLVHTIKGTCGFLGLPRLEAVAHAGENVLGNFRDGTQEVTPDAVTLILEALDRVKSLLSALEATEAEPEGDDADLIGRLDHMYRTATDGTEAPVPVEVAQPLIEEVVAKFDSTRDAAIADGGSAEAPVDVAPAPVANQSIRVNVDVLENLMTMVSELVLTRNQLMQMVREFEDSEFKVPLRRLSHVTTDLREGIMKTRMQPIGNAWGKLPRIIRDLSRELGKKIDLRMLGAETELDRQVLEMIKDPLIHMVRNSADHGVEMPAERAAAGKPEQGTVTLNAFHEGGHIIIEIADDGRGIRVDKVKEKAIEKGMATELELENMPEQQILQFILKPGFSTADKVTSVSGRGVGMDVVRTNIEKIGGQIELRSESGRGSTFIIKIPLTLAIVSALIVECREERFAIPQLSVVELVRITRGSEHRIEKISDTPVLRLRDRLLPLVSLAELLALGSSEVEPFAAEKMDAVARDAPTDEIENDGADPTGGETFIVVAQVGNYSFGIIVDRVFDTEEIVVKPVAPILRDIDIYSGSTILGDGSVIMILDPNGIAAATSEIMLADQAAANLGDSADGADNEKTAFLVFRTKEPGPKAVPLALVARLEELDRASIEYSHGVPVVQYRGRLMPLLSVDDSIQLEPEGTQPVLVFTDQERSMGLMVEEIVDIVEDQLNIELASGRKGILGSAVIDGKATEVIDASAFLARAFGDGFGSRKSIDPDLAEAKSSILLIVDSPFFRDLLTPLLNVAGYRVTTADSADNALLLREQGETFDIIVSDIEMPGMTGFDFARHVRDGGAWQDTPLVALSSHAAPSDRQKGRQVGFDDYAAKLDRDALLHSISETLTGVRGAA